MDNILNTMTYQEALDYLYASVPTFHRQGAGAYKPGLGTSLRLSAMKGDPHTSYRTIHIAGTNGKGSTAHTLAAILQSAGLRTGLYTSPHIFDFAERIRVNGRKIPQQEVVNFVEWWIGASAEHPDLTPSFFELTSTMAFWWFARESVDVAVIETGLGGRLDSTNIITPELSVITNISLDHTAFLGDTLPLIAAEKAGIIKSGVPVVIGQTHPDTKQVFVDAALRAASPIVFADRLECVMTQEGNIYPSTPFGPLRGELQGIWQVENASTVVSAVSALRRLGWEISDKAVSDGFADVTGLTHLFGRWSRIGERPLTIADTGHNIGGWEQIVRQINAVDAPRKCLVLGFVADKDLSHVLPLVAALKGDVRLWFATPSVPRGMHAVDLASQASSYGLSGTVTDDVNLALARAREAAGPEGFVLVGGSNFLIADLDRGSIDGDFS